LLVWLLMRVVSLFGAPIYIAATVRENRARSHSHGPQVVAGSNDPPADD
jgi:hypothetical protein